MHPELAKAIKTAKRAHNLNGTFNLEKESGYKTEIAQLRNKVVDLERDISSLKSQLLDAQAKWPRQNPPALSKILETAARVFGMEPCEIINNRRHSRQALVRQVVCYLAFTMTPHNDSEIAKFVHRDRTSVIHGRAKVAALLERMPELRAKVEEISRDLVSATSSIPQAT